MNRDPPPPAIVRAFSFAVPELPPFCCSSTVRNAAMLSFRFYGPSERVKRQVDNDSTQHPQAQQRAFWPCFLRFCDANRVINRRCRLCCRSAGPGAAAADAVEDRRTGGCRRQSSARIGSASRRRGHKKSPATSDRAVYGLAAGKRIRGKSNLCAARCIIYIFTVNNIYYYSFSVPSSAVSGIAWVYLLRTSSGDIPSRGLFGVTTTSCTSRYPNQFLEMKIPLAGLTLPLIM